MEIGTISEEQIQGYCRSLLEKELSDATIRKYKQTIVEFEDFLAGRMLKKMEVLSFREELRIKHKPQTVNVKLCAINSFLDFIESPEMKIKLLRIQHYAFIEDGKELTESEYKRLLASARELDNERLYNVMSTICGTGIRISELRFITVEAIRLGRVMVSMKGKERLVIIPQKLRKQLLIFAKDNKICSGSIFITKNGKTLDRSNICHDMKKLCKIAKVDNDKVFPQNLRHLFARSFYEVERNIAHLSDILGHSSIETTRIYVATSAKHCEQVMDQMHLI